MKKRELKDCSVASKTPRAASEAQLELSLPPAKSAAILNFAKSASQTAFGNEVKKIAANAGPDSSKRILDFAATLPDW